MTFFGLKLQGQDQENRAAHPNQELPGEPPSAVFLVASRGSAIHAFHYIKETQGLLRGIKANDKQKRWCRKCSLLQRAFPKLEKHIQQHLVEKALQDRLSLKSSSISINTSFFFFFFGFVFLLTYASELALAKVQHTILNFSDSLQLLKVRFYILHDVAPALLVFFPKPIDLPLSKPLISLVPITYTTYCFQGQGHCYVTIPIVFPANQKPCLKQLQDNPPKQ